jgi:1-pyrroline-5-carboxylate dehydrogenase
LGFLLSEDIQTISIFALQKRFTKTKNSKMAQGIYHVPNVPVATNEPVLDYKPGSPEKAALKAALKELKSIEMDIPMFIDGKEVRTKKTKAIHPPHELKHTLGHFHVGGETEIKMAIDAALKAKKAWADLNWDSRASIFLRAAEMISGSLQSQNQCCHHVVSIKKCFSGRNRCSL